MELKGNKEKNYVKEAKRKQKWDTKYIENKKNRRKMKK